MEEDLKNLAKEFCQLGESDIADQLEEGNFPLLAISQLEGRAHRIIGACNNASAFLAKVRSCKP